MKKHLLPALTFFVGFAAALAGLYVYQAQRAAAVPPDVPGFLWPEPKRIGEFALSDQHAKPFDLSRVRGKWTFWYFGYTSCPDACPMTMTVMNGLDQALAATPELHRDVQFSFVSVDPARDDLEHLASYVSYFNPAFIASTGDLDRLDVLARHFGVLYNLHEPDEAGNYLVDHTAALLLTDPQARLVGIFQVPHDVELIAEQFRLIRRFLEG